VSNPTVVSPFIDLLDPNFDFYSADLAAAREQHWYARSPIGPVVLRHAEVAELLRDHRFKLGGDGYLKVHNITSGPLYDWWSNALISVELADYHRLRGLMNRTFTPRSIADLQPFIRTTVHRLADQITAETPHDFIEVFADPLAALVMCEVLGVPTEDYARFHSWTGDIAMAFSRADLTGEVLARVDAAIVEMSEYIAELLVHRRREPGGDVLSALLAAEESGDAITMDELHSLTLLLVWAGHDTTARQLGRAMVTFSEHPEQWHRLRRDPALVTGAVEEICRWTPQTRLTTRYALEDLDLYDLKVPAGSQLLACVASANRDPRAFADPDRFDIAADRKAHHFVFGGGIYHCLGAALARLELAEALATLSTRFGAPETVGPVRWRPPMSFIHGPEVLPLSFAAGQ
jgi:cytochrome P450